MKLFRRRDASPTGRSPLFIAALAAIAAVTMAARPGNEFDMLTRLNGQEARWTMADGGASGMFGTGITCMPVADLPAQALSTVEVLPSTPINLCYVNLNGVGAQKWDGGCGTGTNDVNQGVTLQANVPKYVLLKSTTTHLCQATDAGTAITPVFSLQ